MPGSDKQNKMFKKTRGYSQENNPFPVTSCGRRRNDGSPLRCYSTHKRKPNTEEFSKGSCIPK